MGKENIISWQGIKLVVYKYFLLFFMIFLVDVLAATAYVAISKKASTRNCVSEEMCPSDSVRRHDLNSGTLQVQVIAQLKN